MEKDELYKACLLQCLAKQCATFKEIDKLHPLSQDAETCINEAMVLASGNNQHQAISIEKRALLSIFNTIGTGTKELYTIPSGELVISKHSFATKDKYQHNHQPTLEKLKSEIVKLEGMSPKAYGETLLTLLYKYTSQIPSGIAELDDVSLYDYIKTTAAIALSLYDADNQVENPFLLLGADFSGIQQYIYTIVPKRAAKSLKGRSFYLRLLSDTIVRYLLKKLVLYQANIIYNSGGCFYLLLPNSKESRTIIAEAIKTIEKALFKEIGTSLYVAIDYVELSRNALLGAKGDSLPTVWKELFLKRDKKKSHKFSSLLSDNYELFFDTNNKTEVAKKDSITGEEFLPGERAIINKSDKGNDLILRPITSLQIEIGNKLRNTDTIIITEDAAIKTNNKHIAAEPLGLGFTYHFIDSKQELPQLYSQIHSLGERATIVTLNDTNAVSDIFGIYNSVSNILKIEYYGGNEVYIKTKTYEEMSEGDNLNRMGVLRMDVDNLGTIFQSGIPEEKASMARYATLSRSFDYFFSGYLNTLWYNNSPEMTQIIYSGGDDLFIIGRWDAAIEIAEKIRNDFKEYTCQNSCFSLSGGVAIVPAKFPIMATAEESADEESRAKEHACGSYTKDSISFMSTPLNWDKEYKYVKLLKEQILNVLQSKEMPKSFIQKILLHNANADIKNHKIRNIKTYWMIAYDMKRMAERLGKKADNRLTSLVNNFKKDCCNGAYPTLNGNIIETEYHPLELWAVAARWAELEDRTNENNKN